MQFLRNTREWLTPVLQESAFLERGVLTPEEFVRAGDQLVNVFPSWSWSSGEPGKQRPYLPADKQFLSTRRVPSFRRVSHLSSQTMVESILEGESGDDWQAPSLRPPAEMDEDEEVLVNAVDAVGITDTSAAGAKTEKAVSQTSSTSKPAAVSTPAVTATAAASNDDEYDDMEDASAALDAATSIPSNTKSQSSSSSSSPASAAGASDSTNAAGAGGANTIVRMRRYDVSITYDKYYQTPRFWLFGYDESGTPLEPAAIFMDVMQDYAQKTVTIETHPHMSRSHASIHPCQHAAAMKRIIDDLKDCGKEPSVDQYLFIFLKFIQSVVPTIEYDNTQDVQVGAAPVRMSSTAAGAGAGAKAGATASASAGAGVK